MGLYDESKSLFTSEDAVRLTALSGNTLNVLLSRLVKKGIITRLKSGLFNIVPFELGSESMYLSERELIAESIVHQKGLTENDYYISHGTAFELHQMVTQPQLTVSCSVTKRIPNENVHGTQINFHVVKKEQIFGIQKFWIGKDKAVQMSDLERTIIDGLKNPLYCGGIIEVAKGLWMKKDAIDIKRIITYALLLDSGVVIRRLGYLLEIFNLGTQEDRELLEKKLTKTYTLLDPNLFQEGKYLAKWKLRLNVSPEELLGAVRS
jgi:predicted transcriptional regulator of viral defense system